MTAYWQKRFEQVEARQNNLGIEYCSNLEDKYRQAMKDLDNQIRSWYERFAKNNGISASEARQLLNSKELEELKWDVEQYIKYGKQNAIDGQWKKQLENASAKFHVNRLEALKLHCQQCVEKAMGGMTDDVDELLRKVYSDTYYRSAFEIQKGTGIGFDVGKIDERKLEKIINKPWSVDEENFSTKIWKNKTKLVNTIDNELTKMVMTGASPDKVTKSIAKQMGTSYSNAQRLVLTEQAYFTSLAQKDTYSDLSVEEIEIVGTLDSDTCTECGQKDGSHFPAKDMQAGINAPPFHPYCRCTTCPYFDDMDGYRASRNDEGKTVYEIPANMKYSDWKNKFVDGGKKDDIIKKESFSDKIAKIKKDIAKNGGVVTEEHLKQAGNTLMSDLQEQKSDFKKELDDVKAELESNDVYKQIKALNDKLDNMAWDDPQYEELYQKRRILNRDKKYNELYFKVGDAEKKYYGTWETNSEDLKNKLSEIRQMGIGNHDLNKEHFNGRSPMRKIVGKAYEYYPADWVDASISKGKLKCKTVDRGYYNDWYNEIAISGYSESGQISTAFHELGHRFEHTLNTIVKAEKAFYDRRTKGCPLEWLGNGYAKSEVSRKDDFISAYMGKDYGGNAYELVSMGFEYAYTDPIKLWEDEDYAQFIYGTLCLL